MREVYQLQLRVCGLLRHKFSATVIFNTQKGESGTSTNISSKKLFAAYWISQINKKRTLFIDVSILLSALQKNSV